MDILFTNGQDERFIALCGELDEYLNDLVGGEKQRTQYAQHNTTEDIHDVTLIVEDGQAVACGSFKMHTADTAEIKRVFTKPAYRGRGYGKAMMDALERRALAQGYTRLILETGCLLEAAVQLYTQLGFRRIPNYGPYRCMTDSICMEKIPAPNP
jgi:putative acetyltransferase